MSRFFGAEGLQGLRVSSPGLGSTEDPQSRAATPLEISASAKRSQLQGAMNEHANVEVEVALEDLARMAEEASRAKAL